MKWFSIMLIILGLTNVSYAATPAITNVVGAIENGQTLTINGTNMVDQIEGDFSISSGGFEGSSYSADGWIKQGGDGAYDSSVKLLGNKSFRSDIAGSGLTNCPIDNAFGDTLYRSMSRYVRLYVYFSSGFNTIWSTAAYTKMVEYVSPTQVYIQPQPAPGGPTRMFTSITGGTSTQMSLPEKWTTGRWYCIEYYIATNGLTVWVDGVQIGTLSGTINFGAPYPQIGIVNACPVNGTAQMYIDGVMSSTTRVNPASTIEISGDGGSTWKYQEPISLSDTSLTIKASLPALTVSNYLLRVRNNQQQTSASYTLSGGPVAPPGDTQAPTTPSSLVASVVSSNQINLSWSASTDDVAVTGYKIYREGTYIATSASPLYTNTGLSAATAYSYKVSAIDAAGNESSQSSTASATTPAEPTSGTVLFQESFDDNSFSSRGWYDGGTIGITPSNCYSGSCAQFSFTSGATSPSAPYDGAMRKLFTPTDTLYMSYYIKFATEWRGSQKGYHPHMFYVLSDADNAYSGLAVNYLDVYSEFISDIGSPYTIRPSMSVQDTLNTNASSGTPPNNITTITENRSVNYCNGYKAGQDTGTSRECYSVSPYWYSATTWTASSASVSTNAWHHVEVYLKMNSISGGVGQPDGIMQKSIDGVQVINKNNIIYRTNQHSTMKWAQFVIAPFIGDGSPIAQTFWLDDFTLTTAVPNNASVLSKPTGFKILTN